MTDSQMKELLTKALQCKAPDAYRRMKADGTLDTFLRKLMGVTLEAISEPMQEVITGLVTQGSPQFEEHPLKRVQAINMAQKSAEEMALAQAIETIEALSAESEAQIVQPPVRHFGQERTDRHDELRVARAREPHHCLQGVTTMQATIAKNCGFVALVITVIWIAGDVFTGRVNLFDDTHMVRQLVYMAVNFVRFASAFIVLWLAAQAVYIPIRLIGAVLKPRKG